MTGNLRFMKDKLVLNEHSMVPRQSTRAVRLRGTLITMRGKESTLRQSRSKLEHTYGQILGLNDCNSPIPIHSDQSPHFNGWHRVMNSHAVIRRHANTMILDWTIQTLLVDAELELRLSGHTLPNSLGELDDQGNRLGLEGTPVIGLPQETEGFFIPQLGDVPVNFETVYTHDGDSMRRWYLSSAQTAGGVRYWIDPNHASAGQCCVRFDNNIVVGLRPNHRIPSGWSIENGLIMVKTAQGSGSLQIYEAVTDPVDEPGEEVFESEWVLRTTLTPHADLVESNVLNHSVEFEMETVRVHLNEQHSCSLSVLYNMGNDSVGGSQGRLHVAMQRGSRIVSFGTEARFFAFVPSDAAAATMDGFFVHNGANWAMAANGRTPGTSTTARNLLLHRTRVGFIGLPVANTEVARTSLLKEWLGGRGGTVNWVLR